MRLLVAISFNSFNDRFGLFYTMNKNFFSQLFGRLHFGWLLTEFEQVKKWLVVLLTLSKSNVSSNFFDEIVSCHY